MNPDQPIPGKDLDEGTGDQGKMFPAVTDTWLQVVNVSETRT